MEGTKNEAIFESFHLKPQHFINEVLNIVDELVDGAFDYIHQEASMLLKTQGTERSEDLKLGINCIRVTIQSILDKRLAGWEQYCLRHCFAVPPGFSLPYVNETSSDDQMEEDDVSVEQADAQLDLLKKKLSEARKESAELDQELQVLERKSTMSDQYVSSVNKALELYHQSSAYDMFQGNRDDYRFLKIADALVAVNQKVNLIGVIAEYSVPKRSKGTDWFCSLRVVDESHDSYGLLVNIFVETIEKLPKVEALGDIIELSQVKMKTHNTEIYALFNKEFSSFNLYEGKYSQSCNPYQTSTRFRPKDQDMTFVHALRKWVDGFQLDTASKESVLLQELKEGDHLDLICKILHVLEVSKDEWMLFVWDGCDVPQLQIHSKLENEVVNPLPLQLEPKALDRDTLCMFPTVGTVLRIFVDQRNVELNLSSLNPGRWVKYINLAVEIHEGLWRGVLTQSSKIRLVPNEDRHVLERERAFEKRISSKWDRMPFTSFPWPSRITEIDDELEEVPNVTLMDIIMCPQVTAKFKCIARVVAAFPWKVEDFRSSDGTYCVRLTLEDPTARLHAYLYADDGEVFFDGNPPIPKLTKQWNTLLGVAEVDKGSSAIEEAPRNPPWVVFCIKSYCISKTDVWTRRFCVFKTKLTC